MSSQQYSQSEGEPNTLQIEVSGRTLADVIKSVEADYLGHVLTEAKGNKRKAASLAGLSHETFRRKLALYTIRAVFSVG